MILSTRGSCRKISDLILETRALRFSKCRVYTVFDKVCSTSFLCLFREHRKKTLVGIALGPAMPDKAKAEGWGPSALTFTSSSDVVNLPFGSLSSRTLVILALPVGENDPDVRDRSRLSYTLTIE